MPTKFLETLGSKLVEKWLSAILTPAFFFWIGGLSLWVWQNDWMSIELWLAAKSQASQIALLVGALLIVLFSAIVVERFEFMALRSLEGYWPRWLSRLRLALLFQEAKQVRHIKKRFQPLAEKQDKNQLTSEEKERFVSLDIELRQVPINNLMPTRLGNILRAAEERSQIKYGLDSIVCFSRLWLLLPESVQIELSEARKKLDTGARIWLWSVLFLVWTAVTWWAIPIAIGAAYLSYRWALDSAIVYGDLLESVFDIYRTLLYQSLRFPLPSRPEKEKELGEKVTQYLWGRNFEQLGLTFTDSSDNSEQAAQLESERQQSEQYRQQLELESQRAEQYRQQLDSERQQAERARDEAVVRLLALGVTVEQVAASFALAPEEIRAIADRFEDSN